MVSQEYSGKVGTEPEEPSWRQTTGDSKQHNWEGGKQGEHALQPDRKWGEELLSRQAGRGRVRHTAVKRMSDWKESHSNREQTARGT